MTKITAIAADYNQVRAEIQGRLLTELNEDRQAELAATQRLAIISTKAQSTQQALLTSQKVDTPALKQQLNTHAKTIATLHLSIEQAQHTQATYSRQLSQQNAKQAKLSTAIAQCETQRQAIITVLHTEEDPFRILDLAETYRQQLQLTAQNNHRLTRQLANLTSTQTALTQKQADSTAKLTALQKQLAQATSQQAIITAKLAKIHTQQTNQYQQQLQHFDQVTQQTKAQLVKLTHQIAQKEDQLTTWFGNAHQVSPLTVDAEHQYAISLDAFLPNQPHAMLQTVQRLLALGTEQIGLYSALFDINLSAEIDAWASQNGIASSQLKLINPLFQIQNQGTPSNQKATLPTNIAEKHWDETHQVLNLKLADNQWRLKVTYQPDEPNNIRDISYFKSEALTKRSFYNHEGRLSANALFNHQGILKQEQYYRQDGLVGLVVNYHQGQQSEVQLFDQSGIQTNTFTNTTQLTTWWIKHYFPRDCALIGQFESPAYTQLIDQTNLEAVPYISEANLSTTSLTQRLAAATATRFIVNNHKAAQALIQTANENLELLSLNAVYLPFQIAGPLVAN